MIEIRRNGVAITTITPTGDLVTYDDVSDDEGLADPNTEWGERMYTYTARHVSGSILGQESAPVSRWAGPDSPRLTLVQAMSTNQYVVVWEIPPGGANTEVWDNWDDTNHTLSSEFFLAADESDHDASVFVDSEFGPGPGIGPAADQTIALRIRHRVRNFNVDDYSAFVYTAVKLPSS